MMESVKTVKMRKHTSADRPLEIKPKMLLRKLSQVLIYQSRLYSLLVIWNLIQKLHVCFIKERFVLVRYLKLMEASWY